MAIIFYQDKYGTKMKYYKWWLFTIFIQIRYINWSHNIYINWYGHSISSLGNCGKWGNVHSWENTTDHSVSLIIYRQMVSLYGTNGEIRPQELARCMIDTYRAMNRHFIPTGY